MSLEPRLEVEDGHHEYALFIPYLYLLFFGLDYKHVRCMGVNTLPIKL